MKLTRMNDSQKRIAARAGSEEYRNLPREVRDLVDSVDTDPITVYCHIADIDEDGNKTRLWACRGGLLEDVIDEFVTEEEFITLLRNYYTEEEDN